MGKESLTESKLQAYAFTEGDEQIVDKEFVTKGL